MDIELDFNKLADTAAQDKEMVEQAVLRVIRTVKAIVRNSDDPEEAVEHLDWLAGQGKRSRANVRDHKPVAAISSSSAPAAALLPDSDKAREVYELLQAIANGYKGRGTTPEELIGIWRSPMMHLGDIPQPKRNYVAAVISRILGNPDMVDDDEAQLELEKEYAALKHVCDELKNDMKTIGSEVVTTTRDRVDANAVVAKIRELKQASEGAPNDERFKQRLHEVGDALGADDPVDVRQIRAKIRELKEEHGAVETETLEKIKKAVTSTFRSRIVLAKEKLPEDYVERLTRR